MLFLDANAYAAWRDLLEAASAYAAHTGGRYAAEDFDAARGRATDDDAAFARAKDEARAAVATFRLLAEEGDITLVADYVGALEDALDQAAHNAMAAALRARDRSGGDDGFDPDVFDPDAAAAPLTPDFVRDASDGALAARLEALAAARAEPRAAARSRAASFVADFGAAHGLDAKASPATEALLRAFDRRVDASVESKSAFADALEPYKELLDVEDLAGAKTWASCHREEALVVGAAALAIGAGALALLFAGGRSRRRK